jgi:hypothetical protein
MFGGEVPTSSARASPDPLLELLSFCAISPERLYWETSRLCRRKRQRGERNAVRLRGREFQATGLSDTGGATFLGLKAA